MAQTLKINETDSTEVDFSEVDENERFKYDDEVYLRLKTSLGANYNCIKIEDGAGANRNDTDKVKKYTSVEITLIKTK